MLSEAVAWSSFGGVAIHYVHPVLWMNRSKRVFYICNPLRQDSWKDEVRSFLAGSSSGVPFTLSSEPRKKNFPSGVQNASEPQCHSVGVDTRRRHCNTICTCIVNGVSGRPNDATLFLVTLISSSISATCPHFTLPTHPPVVLTSLRFFSAAADARVGSRTVIN